MRGFREVGWVAAVAGTALGCYMVSLKVASERAALEQVENKIVLAQRDIRVLQTEIGTRGRLEQLESWNVKVLALSAPQAQQFLEGEFQLATLAAPTKKVDPAAPVVLASAPAPAPQRPALADDDDGEAKAGPTARDLMQVASYRRETSQAPEKTVDKAPAPKPQPVKLTTAPAKAAAKAVPVTRVEAATKAPAAKAPAKIAETKVAVKADTKVKAPAATPSKPKDAKARQ
jgi:hypothetical protein